MQTKPSGTNQLITISRDLGPPFSVVIRSALTFLADFDLFSNTRICVDMTVSECITEHFLL